MMADPSKSDIPSEPPAVVGEQSEGSEIPEKFEEPKPDVAVPVQIEDAPREQWESKVGYMLTLVGYAVGFGNIWRFPYLVQENGGVAFLIPYTIMLVLEGIPLFYLELAVGQRLRKGGVGCWNEIHPWLGGVGIAMGVTCFLVEFYYNTLVAYVFSYVVDSFRDPLPWTNCSTAIPSGLSESMQKISMQDCEIAGQVSKYYWFRRTLDVSESITAAGKFNGYMFLYLSVSWILVWVILVKGIKLVGKIVYFTALFPYVVLLIFFVANFFNSGWSNGFTILFYPDFSKLLDADVWLKAGTQIFFSLGVGYGCLIAFASYLPPRNNCARDAVIISIINCSTSLFAAIVVFPILGAGGQRRYDICVENNPNNISACSLEDEVRKGGSGTGLVFIAFAEASLNIVGPSQLWCFLFFFMLLTLGIDSSFGTLEGAIVALEDMKLVKWSRPTITSVMCVVLWVFSAVFACGFGTYVLVLLDQFVANWTLLIIAFFETVGIAWVYGLPKFSYDIMLMTGSKPSLFFLLCWKVISPGLIVIILIAEIVAQCLTGYNYTIYDVHHGNMTDTAYPGEIIALGYILWLTAVIWIPLQMLLTLLGKPEWLIKKEAPVSFPEEELRVERNLNDPEDTGLFDTTEMLIMGSKSLEDFKSYRQSMQSVDGEPESSQITSDFADKQSLGSSSPPGTSKTDLA